MPKSKHAPALFELIESRSARKGSDKMAVPKWFKRSEAAAPSAAEGPETDPTTEEAAPAPVAAEACPPRAAEADVAHPPVPAVPRVAASAAVRLDRPPIFRLDNGRLELSLNPVNASIAAAVILLAVLSSFLIGQGIASRGSAATAGGAVGADDIQQALKQPAQPDILKAGGPTKSPGRTGSAAEPAVQTAGPSQAGTAAKPQPAADRAGRDPAMNYVVVESFKQEHKKSAEHVRQWLQDRYSLETTLERSGDYWRLVTVLGFDFRESGQKESCQQFLTDLQSIGDACAKELSGNNLPVYRLTGPFAQNFGK